MQLPSKTQVHCTCECWCNCSPPHSKPLVMSVNLYLPLQLNYSPLINASGLADQTWVLTLWIIFQVSQRQWLGFQITLGWQENEEIGGVKEILQLLVITVQIWSRTVFRSKMRVNVKRNMPAMDSVLTVVFNQITLLPAIFMRRTCSDHQKRFSANL
jgi:hypothetical protein